MSLTRFLLRQMWFKDPHTSLTDIPWRGVSADQRRLPALKQTVHVETCGRKRRGVDEPQLKGVESAHADSMHKVFGGDLSADATDAANVTGHRYLPQMTWRFEEQRFLRMAPTVSVHSFAGVCESGEVTEQRNDR